MPNYFRPSADHIHLFEAILRLRDTEECSRFFEDICTINELNEMAKRLRVAEMLCDGKSYVQISQETGVSTATISRVNRCLSYGSNGYALAMDRLKEDKEEKN
jgi:TrpR-related protein YerC/YecD